MSDVFVITLVASGSLFMLAGTIGLLRFPDIFSRLHALTKADNVGLGFIVLGLMVHADSWLVRAKLLLIWLLVLGAAATSCHLIARAALEHHLDEDAGG